MELATARSRRRHWSFVNFETEDLRAVSSSCPGATVLEDVLDVAGDHH